MKRIPKLKKYQRYLAFLLVFLLLIDVGYGQKKMYLSYEMGITFNRVTFNNPQRNVNLEQNTVPIPGFIITRQIKKSWYVETGIYQGFLGADMIKSGEFDSTNVQFAQEQIHIPLRVQTRTTVFDDHLHLFATIGANVVLASGGYTFEFITQNNNTEALNKRLRYKPTYILGELGMGFDLFLSKRFFVGGRYRFNLGFTQILNIMVTTLTAGENNIEDYNLVGHGSFHAFMISMGFRIGKLDKVKKI